jgi:signal transduction histidine kinase
MGQIKVFNLALLLLLILSLSLVSAEVQEIKASTSLQNKAYQISQSFEDLLDECVEDTLKISSSNSMNLDYLKKEILELSKKNKEIWYNIGSDNSPISQKETIPTYKQIIILDKLGKELLFLENGKIISTNKDLSIPSNTEFKSETFFQDAKELSLGKVNIGKINTWYTFKEDVFKKLPAESLDKYELVVARDLMKEGVVRFSSPIYVNGEFQGVIVLSLDYRHIQELTKHIDPLNSEPILSSTYNGNYILVFDIDGNTIVHPKPDNIRGYLQDGSLAGFNQPNSETPGKIFNLFKYTTSPSYPEMADKLINRKETYISSATDVSGRTKLVVAVPIIYSNPQTNYVDKGVFGGLMLSVTMDEQESLSQTKPSFDTSKIKTSADLIAKQIEIYLLSNPTKTVKDLKNDPYFREIAVQPIGIKGYTVLYDYDSMINIIHNNPEYEGIDYNKLKEISPSFWNIASKTIGGKSDAEGFYTWNEPNGEVSEKYMYNVIIPIKTADGKGLVLATTTYLEEYAPATDIKINSLFLQEKINLFIDKIDDRFDVLSKISPPDEFALNIIKESKFEDVSQFENFFAFIDGTWRTNLSFFEQNYDTKDVTGALIYAGHTLTDEKKQLMIKLNKDLKSYAFATQTVFSNRYITFENGVDSMYPNEWIFETGADEDFKDDLWYAIANPKNNPLKESVWTPTYYDAVLKQWMVSLITPIYDGYKFLGTTGGDVPLDEIYSQIEEYNYNGQGYSLIFDQDKNILIHPNYEEIINSVGEMEELFSFNQLNEKNLSQTINKIKDESGQITFMQDGEEYLFIYSKLENIDWYYGFVIQTKYVDALNVGNATQNIFQKYSIYILFTLLVILLLLIFLLTKLIFFKNTHSSENKLLKRTKLSKKLIMYFLILAMIPFIMSSFLVLYSQNTASEQIISKIQNYNSISVDDELQRDLDLLSDSITTQIHEFKVLFEIIAQDTHLLNSLNQFKDLTVFTNENFYLKTKPEEWHQVQSNFLNAYKTSYPNIELLRVFHKNGWVVNSIALGKEDLNDYKGDKSWFKETMDTELIEADQTYVSAISIARKTNTPAIRYTTPLEIHSERIGLFVINFKSSAITQKIQQYQRGLSGESLLVDFKYETAEGQIIGHPVILARKFSGETYPINELDVPKIPFQQMNLNLEGKLEYVLNGETWYAHYKKINFQDKEWYLFITVLKEELELPVKTIQEGFKEIFSSAMNISLFLFLVLILFIIGISRVFSKTITKPLDELDYVSKQIQIGNFEVKSKINTDNEIQDLSDTLNRTIEILKQRDEEHKQIDKMKTEFMSITSHELRSPMTPMRAQLQMLLGNYYGAISKKQKDALDIILRNTERLDRIIMDFLELSRIEAARLKFNFKKVSLNSYANNVIKEMKSFLPEKKISLIDKIDSLPIMEVDPDRVMQILRNLIGNAVKFTPAKGKIWISASKKTEGILFSVKDTGVGISEADQLKLFQPFSQIDNMYQHKSGGTGLGLAICKGIIESQNGRIWVESEGENKGTTFYFILPYEPVKEIKPIKVLFSASEDVEKKLLDIFKEYLGPMGEKELDELKKSKSLIKSSIMEYLDELKKNHILRREDLKDLRMEILKLFSGDFSEMSLKSKMVKKPKKSISKSKPKKIKRGRKK